MSDSWDEAAKEYQPQPGTAAPASDKKSASDPFQDAAESYSPTATAATEAPEEKGTLSKAWDFVNKPLVPEGSTEKQLKEYSNSVPTLEESKHPYLTALKKGGAGAVGSVAELGGSMLSPLGIGTLAAGPVSEAGGALGKIGGAASKLAGLGFGAMGAKEAYKGGSDIAENGLTPENTKQTLGGLGQIAMGAAAPLHGTDLGGAEVGKVATSPVRGAAKAYNVAREVPALPGYLMGGITGAKLASAVGKVLPEAGEDMTMAGYSAPERLVLNQEALANDAQQRFNAADKARAKYLASEAQGVPAPPEVIKEYNDAQAKLAEARQHLTIAQQDAARIKARQPAPAAPGTPLGRIPTPETAPAAKTGEALGGVKTPKSAPLGEISTPATRPVSQSGEALGGTPLKNPLGEIRTPASVPARESGEALNTVPIPAQATEQPKAVAEPVEAPKAAEPEPEKVRMDIGKLEPGKVEPPAEFEPTAQPIEEPKEEAKQEPGLTGPEYKEETESAAELHPVVQEAVSKLSNENLKKLGQKLGLNPEEYNFKRREALREGGSKHPVERHKFINDLMNALPEEEKLNIGRAIKADEGSENFADRDTSSKGKAERAALYFPKLREAPAKEMSEGDVADFEHTVNNAVPMGPTPLKELREFTSQHTDKPIKFLSAGGEQSVFDLGNDHVLKVGKGEVPKVPNLPEVLQPIAQKSIPGATGEYHASVFPKLKTTNIPYSAVKDMNARMDAKGFNWDYDPKNLGITPDGEFKIIDAGGITKKPAKELTAQ